MVVRVQYLQHLDPLVVRYFLGIPRVRHRLIVIVLQPNVAQLSIRHIFHIYPFHLELASPLVLRPDAGRGVVVHRRHHLCHATEVARPVHREEQHYVAALFVPLLEGVVQSLIAVVG